MTSLSSPSIELVARFLENVRSTVPLGIEQIDVMLRLIEAARGHLRSFLDLGCGDGVLSSAIFEETPDARGCLVELSEPMLQVARHRLRAQAEGAEFVAADFLQSGWVNALTAAAPFDAIVSGFALHAVPDERKRELFGELHSLLSPDGIFINIEHVSSATRWTESQWDDYMIDAIFGPQPKGGEGKPRAEVAREYYRREATVGSIHAPLEVQLDWLREAGFENVECFLKVQELAMFGGQRGEIGTVPRG